MVYQNGEIIEGEITGVQPYGAFVKFENDQYGLIHISEMSRDFIKDINHFVRVNQKIKVKVIDYDVESKHYKLSLKALQQNLSKEKRKAHRSIKLPKMEIGFTTIEKHLQRWIEEAKAN